MTTQRVGAALLLALALAFSACGGSSSKTGGGGGGNADACGLSEFASAKKPVEVTFWQQLQGSANQAWLKQTTAKFNASQNDVHVKVVQFPNYQDLLTKYLAGLSTGDLPTLFQPEDTTVQRLIDSKSTMPLQACVDADHYVMTDFVPRATAFYSNQNELQGMPWSVSNIVLYYNRTAFEKAGLDPDNPPKTFDEVKAASQKIVASGAAKHGIALRIEPYIFEFLNAKSGGTLVNNGNGRDTRATAATLDAPVPLKIWTWWNDMVKSGLADNTGATPSGIEHLLALGNDDAAMTFESGGNIGNIKKALEGGQYSTVKIDAAPLPSFDGDGGVPVGDGSLWITKASLPAQRAAAWQFVKYLSSTEQQASLAAEGGFAPIRTSATEVPELKNLWNEEPMYRVTYDQLVSGPTTAATVGPLIGDYQGVRDAVKSGLVSMLTAGLSPKAALEKAQREADAAIKAYNDRLGVG